MCGQFALADSAQVEPLAPGQHRDRHHADFRRCEHEFHMLGRLLQGLEQRVERVVRKHVDFVDDVDLVPGGRGPVGNALDDFPHVRDAGPGGGIHFENIDMPTVRDREAVLALSARIGSRDSISFRTHAIQALRDQPRRCGFPHPSHAGQNERMGNPVRLERVPHHADHGVLPDYLGERLRPVLPREDFVRSVHCDSFVLAALAAFHSFFGPGCLGAGPLLIGRANPG